MQITNNIRLVDNIYHVEIDLHELTLSEQEAINKFGEPLIECGGNFDDLGGLTFDLDSDIRKFPSEFPCKYSWDRGDYEDAADRADLWRDTILDRLDTAVTAKRAETSANLGSNTTSIDTTPA